MAYDIVTEENILHQRSQEVIDIKDPKVQSICAKLLNFVLDKKNGAVGLAAIQLGVPLRIFARVVSDRKGFTRRVVEIVINPTIVWESSVTTDASEMCLSEPGISVRVRRKDKIQLKYTDIYGNDRTVMIEGFDAQVVQHECDHLDGILLVDKFNYRKGDE